MRPEEKDRYLLPKRRERVNRLTIGQEEGFVTFRIWSWGYERENTLESVALT